MEKSIFNKFVRDLNKYFVNLFSSFWVRCSDIGTRSHLRKVYHKIHLGLIVFLLIILPFNGFLQVFFKHNLGIGAVAYLKEFLILLIIGMNAGWWLFMRKRRSLVGSVDGSSVEASLREGQFSVQGSSANAWLGLRRLFGSKSRRNRESRKLLWLILLFIAWAVASFSWTENPSLLQLVYGFKYDVFFLVLMLVGVGMPEEVVRKKAVLIKVMLWSYGVALVVGAVLHVGMLDGTGGMVKLGYRNDWSTFYAGESLAFCQKIEHVDLCRFQGVFSGPNQAGANILLFLVVAFSFWQNKLGWRRLSCWGRGMMWVTVGLALVLLFLTFSRSSWLGLMGLVLVGAFLLVRDAKVRKWVIAGIGGGLVVGLGLVAMWFPEVVMRYASNSERLELMRAGFEVFKENWIVGQGMGISGPASHFTAKLTGSSLITENWFLQVMINYGVVGLFLFVGILWRMVCGLSNASKLRSGVRIWAVFLIALIVPLNLLHYFEDSSFSYGLFLMIGILLSEKR